MTDLTLRVKYRLLRGAPGHLSILAGSILPTGNDDERLGDGDRLEPSSQPRTGEFGLLGGLAYSRYLTSHVAWDASSMSTHRFEHDDFRLGSRVDTNTGLAYRLTELTEPGAQLALFGEVNHVWLGHDAESGKSNPNSGGNTIFLTPGVRVSLAGAATLALAAAVPVVQNLNGDQAETDFRILAQLAVLL